MADTGAGLHRHIGFRSATALVIANVIGARVFTTTGFQAADLGNPVVIFLLWAVGGLLAYCGALCYSELGAAMPQAGGEYVYLREGYGRFAGFMSAFVSLIAGFPAPIAAATKSLIVYMSAFFPVIGVNPILLGVLHLNDLLALLVLWGLIGVQFLGSRQAISFNNLFTLLKVGGIVLIILAAAAVGNGNLDNFSYVSDSYRAMSGAERSAAMGTSLIFVMFCYSGWNAAAYVAGEIVEPQRNLPRSLLAGTLIVTALYICLNAVYLYGANVDALAGKVEVGLVSSRILFGEWGARLVTVVLAVSLLASASAMTVAGPRVYFALGADSRFFRWLNVADTRGIPSNALLLQGLVTSVIIVSGAIDQIIQYAGFTLALTSALAVSAVIRLRMTQPALERPFRVPGYPLTPLLFIVISIWTMFWAFRGRPLESMLALLTVAAAALLFVVAERRATAARG
jgi:APA family basic amino acid/polyamine antiporter